MMNKHPFSLIKQHFFYQNAINKITLDIENWLNNVTFHAKEMYIQIHLMRLPKSKPFSTTVQLCILLAENYAGDLLI